MKAGVFELRAGARYWIQMSASPDPVLNLFMAGPLNWALGDNLRADAQQAVAAVREAGVKPNLVAVFRRDTERWAPGL